MPIQCLILVYSCGQWCHLYLSTLNHPELASQPSSASHQSESCLLCYPIICPSSVWHLSQDPSMLCSHQLTDSQKYLHVLFQPSMLLQPFVQDPRHHSGGPMNGGLRLWHGLFSFTCLLASTQDYSILHQSSDWVPRKAGDQHFCFEGLYFSIWPFKAMTDTTIMLEITMSLSICTYA